MIFGSLRRLVSRWFPAKPCCGVCPNCELHDVALQTFLSDSPTCYLRIRLTESRGDGCYAWSAVRAAIGPDGKPVLVDGAIKWLEEGPVGTFAELPAWEMAKNPLAPIGLVVMARYEPHLQVLHFQCGTCQ